MSIIIDSGLLATKIKPVASKQNDRTMDTSTGVVLQVYDVPELTIEINVLLFMFSLGNNSTILCLSIFLSVNGVVPDTINNTC
jgi:hypothetical protein